jgi:hypothetical protein
MICASVITLDDAWKIPENAKKEKQAKTTKGEKKALANPQMVEHLHYSQNYQP